MSFKLRTTPDEILVVQINFVPEKYGRATDKAKGKDIVPKQEQSGCGLPDARPRPCPH